MLGSAFSVRYAVVIALGKEHDHSNTSTVYCLQIHNFVDEEQIRIHGNPFRLLDNYNRGSHIWEDCCLGEVGIEVGAIIAIEERRDCYFRNTGKKMAMDRVLSQLQFGSGEHGVVFRGIKEAFPDAVITPDRTVQSGRPHPPCALISVLASLTNPADDKLVLRTRLGEIVELNNRSCGEHKRGSCKLVRLPVGKPSPKDVGTVILVAFHSKTSLGLSYQAVCEGILVCSSLGQKEKTLTGVILAISKHDESASMVYAREVDADFNGNGQPFQLANDQNGFTWQNEHLTAENLKFGSVVTYRKHDGNVYSNKVDCRPQDVTKIQMDLGDTECVFPGIRDAFPKAKLHVKGLSMDEMPNPCIAAIGLRTACIKNERIQLTTFQGEEVNLKLLCREHLHLSPSSIKLQLRESYDSLQDSALVKFVETQHATRQPIYSAVCVGLLLRFKPTVISISEEPVQIKDGNGRWILVPGAVLFDSGNESATAVSTKLVDELDLQPDRRKLRRLVVAGGEGIQCSTVAIEVNVRGHNFKVDASVGATAPDTDLLIGTDIMKPLIEKKYTFGE